MKKAGVLSYPLNGQRKLCSDWEDAQADLSLRWAHTHFVGFVMSRLNYIRDVEKVPNTSDTVPGHLRLLRSVFLILNHVIYNVPGPVSPGSARGVTDATKCCNYRVHKNITAKEMNVLVFLKQTKLWYCHGFGLLLQNEKNYVQQRKKLIS